MARDNKVSLPSGMSGLVRYFDDYKSKLEVSPGFVVFACVVVIILIIILRAYGERWLA